MDKNSDLFQEAGVLDNNENISKTSENLSRWKPRKGDANDTSLI